MTSLTNSPTRNEVPLRVDSSALAAKLAHSANEWADMATNGIQHLRNIIDGISTPQEALADMTAQLVHCKEVSSEAIREYDDAKGREGEEAAYAELSQIILTAGELDPWCSLHVGDDPVMVDDAIVLLRGDPRLRELLLAMFKSMGAQIDHYKALYEKTLPAHPIAQAVPEWKPAPEAREG